MEAWLEMEGGELLNHGGAERRCKAVTSSSQQTLGNVIVSGRDGGKKAERGGREQERGGQKGGEREERGGERREGDRKEERERREWGGQKGGEREEKLSHSLLMNQPGS